MHKGIIIKVIRGEATPQESQQVLDWINESEQNLRFFSDQKLMWAMSTMPIDAASDAELNSFHLKQKISSLQRKKNMFIKLFSFSAAAAILILVYTTFNLSGRLHQAAGVADTKVDKTVTQTRVMYAERGIKGKVTLPDGSNVWLNSDSKIIYPTTFDGDTREVEISGEAYFEVVSDKLHPMIVKTHKGVKIKVLGTKFSIKSYDNDKDCKAVLYSGSINLLTTDPQQRKEISTQMRPNEIAVIPNYGEPQIIKSIDKKKELAWMSGELIFENTSMVEVFKVLERAYGKSFVVKDSALLRYNLSAVFKTESLSQILEVINLCTNSHSKILGERVLFN